MTHENGKYILSQLHNYENIFLIHAYHYLILSEFTLVTGITLFF